MNKDRLIKLIKEAKEALKNSYSPYSKFRVGSAVLTENGSIYSGTNIENASYGLTICAERVAIFKAISEGAKKIVAIAVISDNSEICVPCGACRQVIWEFGKDIEVIMASFEGEMDIKKIGNLLPQGFILKNKERD